VIMTLVFIFQHGFLIIRIFPVLTILKYLLFTVSLGTFLAIVGALYPASVSAKMEPAEAIRREV